jgi:hypothetical protein
MTAIAIDLPRFRWVASVFRLRPMNAWRRGLRVAVCAVALTLAAGRSPALGGEPAATLDVSSSTVTDTVGLSFTEGLLRFRGRRYTVMLRGVESGAEATGTVSNLSEVHEIEGTYMLDAGVLRNQRGVVLTFDPPLVLPQGRLLLSLRSRIYPKSSRGLHGRFD